MQDTSRAEKVVGTTAQLYFYDWEANALTPNGKTVASQLQTQDPTAVTISQGTRVAAPGAPSAGSMSLYQAVKLASKQPPVSSTTARGSGTQYYMFGAPGSAACAARAKPTGSRQQAGQHCLLAGPRRPASQSSRRSPQGLPPGSSAPTARC